MRLLAGRKNCRDFLPPAQGRWKVPKSSLDDTRETVLRDELGDDFRRRLRLQKGEQLDTVGLTKRLAGGRKAYPSVSRVAADPWLRGVQGSAKHRAKFDRLAKVCDALAARGVLGRVLGRPYENFPYEGTGVYPNRHADLCEEARIERDELHELVDELLESQARVRGARSLPGRAGGRRGPDGRGHIQAWIGGRESPFLAAAFAVCEGCFRDRGQVPWCVRLCRRRRRAGLRPRATGALSVRGNSTTASPAC